MTKLLFSNEYEEISSIKDYIRDDIVEIFGREDVSEEEIEERAYMENEFNFDDLRGCFNIQLDEEIIAIGSIGAWNGRFTGYKRVGRNLKSILYSDCDMYKLYIEKGNVRATATHHDGVNYMEYRVVRDGVNIDNLLSDLYNQKEVTRSRLNYYTKSILSDVQSNLDW